MRINLSIPLLIAAGIPALAAAQPAVVLEEVVQITEPLAVYQSPDPADDRLFIVQRLGTISIFENGSLLPTPFLDISSDIISSFTEQGLLDMAFHPDFGDTNNDFFINYTDTNGDTVVRRLSVSMADPDVADKSTSESILFVSQPYDNHNGGQTSFGPDGMLYIGMGDGGLSYDPDCSAQDDGTFLGKLLRLDIDGGSPYAIPSDNPFIGVGDPLDEIWAKGLRNPWRFSFDTSTGDLWIADVGQGLREEVDFQPAASIGGENYGWKIMEGTHCTDAFRLSDCTSPPACNSIVFTDPVYDYARSNGNCAVTGGFVYRGSAIPALQGLYIFGDYCSGRIWAYDPGDDSVDLLIETGEYDSFLTSFGQDRSGELYLSFRDSPNRVMKLVPDPSSLGDWQGFQVR